MTYWNIIAAAAKAAKVSAVLLYSICLHESNGFLYDYTLYDNGSPSFSACQIKEATALQMGWHGKNAMELRDPYVGIKYSALYLRYQQDRYGANDWLSQTAAYNSGTYVEGVDGCPKNIRYIKLVQEKLPKNLRYKLNCGVRNENR